MESKKVSKKQILVIFSLLFAVISIYALYYFKDDIKLFVKVKTAKIYDIYDFNENAFAFLEGKWGTKNPFESIEFFGNYYELAGGYEGIRTYHYRIVNVDKNRRKFGVIVDYYENYSEFTFNKTYDVITVDSAVVKEEIWPVSKIWHKKRGRKP